MTISRRTFIQGLAAAMPLSTLPVVVGAAASIPGDGTRDSMPTALEILMQGAEAGRPQVMVIPEARRVLLEAGRIAAKYNAEGSDVHWMSNNVLGWCNAHCDIETTVFAAMSMLSHYNLPISPGKLTEFQNFYKKCSQYIMGNREAHVDPVTGEINTQTWHAELDARQARLDNLRSEITGLLKS